MLPGETVHSGAQQTCFTCGDFLPFKVLKSPAGWYIGCWCDHHGPHSRETMYYANRLDTERDLVKLLRGEQIGTLRI